MQGKWWTWFVWTIALWTIGRTALSAFSVPWQWTVDQCLLVFLGVCGAVAAGTWGWIWFRGGREAVRAALERNRKRLSTPPSKKSFYRDLVIWTAIASALVLLFNVLQR
jgi:hypothetical protein